MSYYERFWTERLDILERLLRRTTAANPRHQKKTSDEPNDGRLWRSDRARHAEDPAPSAGPDRARLGYLTESDLRRQWLASGEMEMKVGATFEFIWRNSELIDPPGERPEAARRAPDAGGITELDPPRKLAITWGSTGGVTFELEPRGDEVLLTVAASPLRTARPLNVSGGWHTASRVLVAVAFRNRTGTVLGWHGFAQEDTSSG